MPHLYIATDKPDVMRSWGVADATTIGDYERLTREPATTAWHVGRFARRR